MKKLQPYILISAVFLLIIFWPNAAQAGLWDLLGDPMSAVRILAAHIVNLVLSLVSIITSLSAYIFEALLNTSINKIGEYVKPNGVVEIGWKISRDVVNLFFIFILLYIAIGTILRLAGHDAKKLLANLILVALLVNFSLAITKTIVDASNMLAMAFYNQLGGTGVKITENLMNGLQLTTIYGNEPLEVKSSPDPQNTAIFNIIIAGVGGIALLLVTAFVFFAGAIIMAVRTIVILFLMILSPLAFVAMILPQTKKYADRWWQELTCQCLLAPAYMFMIYIVIQAISTGSFGQSGGSFAAMLANPATGSKENIGIFVNYILLIGLMIGSLIVSKSLACAGGAQAIAAAAWTRGKVQNYAKAYGKRGAGWMAEREMKKQKEIEEKGGARGGIMGYARRIPGVGRGLAALSAGREKELAAKQAQYKKQYGSYSEAGLQTMLETPTITSEKRKVVESILKERQAKKEAMDKEKADFRDYKEIAGEEKIIQDEKTGEPIKIAVGGKLQEINNQLNEIMKGKSNDINDYLDGIEAQLENLRGNASPDASTKREGFIHQRGKINRLTKEKEKLETRKEKFEEKQQSRTKEKKLEERMGKIEEKSKETKL